MYKFKKGWKRWKVGDIIGQYEYNRLPYEIKNSIMEEIDSAETIEEVPSTQPEVKPTFTPLPPATEDIIETKNPFRKYHNDNDLNL